VDLDPTNIHSNHLLEGAGYLILNIAAHFPDIYILLENQIEVCPHDIVFHFDADSVSDAALKKTVHPARNLCQAADPDSRVIVMSTSGETVVLLVE